MKKKHRRAVYYCIVVLTSPIWFPLWIANMMFSVCFDLLQWLKTKLRVYDTDPE